MSQLVGYCRGRLLAEAGDEDSLLDFQRNRIKQYCLAHSHSLVDCFQDVEIRMEWDYRPGFAQALDAIATKDADGLICTKLDLFARNTIEGLRIATDLKERGKELVILDLNLDTSTAIGQCMFTVLLAFAQLEQDTFYRRIRFPKSLD